MTEIVLTLIISTAVLLLAALISLSVPGSRLPEILASLRRQPKP